MESKSTSSILSQPITIRASSWPSLFDCPARWYAQNIEGKRLPSSGAAQIGTALHASTAAFDQATLDQSPITVDDAAGVLIDTLHQPNEDVDWGDITPTKIEPVALSLHGQYCTQEAPTHEYVAVEATCEALDVHVDSSEITIRLTGTTDRIRRTTDGKLGVTDLKSGSRRVSVDGHANTAGDGPQLGVYALLAEHSLGEPIDAPGEIIGLNTGKTLRSARVGRGEIENPKICLIGEEGRPGLIEIAAQMFRSGLFFGNPKSNLCSPKYCPAYSTCHFRD
jgi:hypothetical protein